MLQLQWLKSKEKGDWNKKIWGPDHHLLRYKKHIFLFLKYKETLFFLNSPPEFTHVLFTRSQPMVKKKSFFVLNFLWGQIFFGENREYVCDSFRGQAKINIDRVNPYFHRRSRRDQMVEWMLCTIVILVATEHPRFKSLFGVLWSFKRRCVQLIVQSWVWRIIRCCVTKLMQSGSCTEEPQPSTKSR